MYQEINVASLSPSISPCRLVHISHPRTIFFYWFSTHHWWATNLIRAWRHAYWSSVVFYKNRIQYFPDTSLEGASRHWSPNNLITPYHFYYWKLIKQQPTSMKLSPFQRVNNIHINFEVCYLNNHLCDNF